MTRNLPGGSAASLAREWGLKPQLTDLLHELVYVRESGSCPILGEACFMSGKAQSSIPSKLMARQINFSTTVSYPPGGMSCPKSCPGGVSNSQFGLP
jgi:hypothetical protein